MVLAIIAVRIVTYERIVGCDHLMRDSMNSGARRRAAAEQSELNREGAYAEVQDMGRFAAQIRCRRSFAVKSARVFTLVGMLSLPACSGAPCSSAVPPATSVSGFADRGAQTATVVIRLARPEEAAAAMSTQSSAATLRKISYVSPSTMALHVTITPNAGAPLPEASFPCSPASCTATLQAPVGSVSIALSLVDAAHGSGKTLSLTSAIPLTVSKGRENAFNFTADPVVASASALLDTSPSAMASRIAGTAADVPVSIQALDADGNVIVGPGIFRDASGAPVTLTATATDYRAGGSGTVTLSGNVAITTPGVSNVVAHYDGGWLDHTSIAVHASSSLVNTANVATLSTIPHVYEYAVPGRPLGVTTGPDGNIWFATFTGNQIGKMTTGGSYILYPCGCGAPTYLMPGPDGNVWYTEYNSSRVSEITASGVITRYSTLSGPIKIVFGPDGNFWYSSFYTSSFGRLSPSGTNTTFPAGYSATRGLAFDAAGDLWIVPYSGNSLSKFDLQGQLLATYSVANTGSYSDGIVAAPDGNIWFGNFGAGAIEKISLNNGSVTPYPLQSGAQPRDLTVGPDGNLWFTEEGANTIGRISMSGAVTEYSNIATGISTTSQPLGITVGPDGNIWFAESGATSGLAKFVL